MQINGLQLQSFICPWTLHDFEFIFLLIVYFIIVNITVK